jgi:hypothetical protein
MPWVEVLAVLIACHLAGDYLLQTEWQAAHKHGGLGPDRRARRALLAHIATYTAAFVPLFLVLADDLGLGVLAVAAGVAVPHLVQDDGRLLALYVRKVKRVEPSPGPLMMAVDQSFHVITLLFLALIAGS